MANAKPNTPKSASVDPAPEKTQEQAGAGETQPSQTPPRAGGPGITHLVVRARSNGFRRAGRAWPDTETIVAVDDLAENAAERLLAEPELIVTPMTEGGET